MEIPPNQSKLPVPGIKPILIEDELKSSFLDYAMSVVVSQHFPMFVMASSQFTAGSYMPCIPKGITLTGRTISRCA